MSAQDEVLDTRAVFLRDLILRGASVARARNAGLCNAVLDQIHAAAPEYGTTRAILRHQWQAVREVLQPNPEHFDGGCYFVPATAGVARMWAELRAAGGRGPYVISEQCNHAVADLARRARTAHEFAFSIILMSKRHPELTQGIVPGEMWAGEYGLNRATAALAAAGLACKFPPVPLIPGWGLTIDVHHARIQLLRAGVVCSHPDWAGVDEQYPA